MAKNISEISPVRDIPYIAHVRKIQIQLKQQIAQKKQNRDMKRIKNIEKIF